MKKQVLALLALPLLLSACATYRPILDENPKYSKVGEARAEKDIDVCMSKADTYLAKHKADRRNKEVGRGAVGGAIVGGLIGAVSGKGVGGAVGGAAVGAGAGAAGALVKDSTRDNLNPDELKQHYVKNCLERQQYQVIGWK